MVAAANKTTAPPDPLRHTDRETRSTSRLQVRRSMELPDSQQLSFPEEEFGSEDAEKKRKKQKELQQLEITDKRKRLREKNCRTSRKKRGEHSLEETNFLRVDAT